MLIGQFGTFEVDNYGDLLFPVIAEKEIAQRFSKGKLQLYSPLKTLLNSAIHPIINEEGILFHKKHSPDAFLIGGGDIISFATEIASIYSEKWKHPYSPHSACWALPSIFRKSGSPLVWNTPGVPIDFSPEQALMVRHLAEQSDYISVRDETSRIKLRDTGVVAEITVVPDTVLMLPKHFNKDLLKKSAKSIYDTLHLSLGEPLVVQIHPAFLQNHIPHFVSVILELQKKLGRPILLLPIGYCHGDLEILKAMKESSKGAFHLIEKKLEPLEIAAVIAYAGAFLGTSLHGNITAYAYGIPFLIYSCVGLTKLKGFADLIQEPSRVCFTMEQILTQQDLLKQAPSKETYDKLSKQIEHHFDRIVKIITTPSPYQEDPHTQRLLEQYLILMHRNDEKQRQLQTKEQELNHKNAVIQNLQPKPSLIKRIVKKLLSVWTSKRVE